MCRSVVVGWVRGSCPVAAGANPVPGSLAAAAGSGYLAGVAPLGRGGPRTLVGAAFGGAVFLADALAYHARTPGQGVQSILTPAGPLRFKILWPDPLTASLLGRGWAPVRAEAKAAAPPNGRQQTQRKETTVGNRSQELTEQATDLVEDAVTNTERKCLK